MARSPDSQDETGGELVVCGLGARQQDRCGTWHGYRRYRALAAHKGGSSETEPGNKFIGC